MPTGFMNNLIQCPEGRGACVHVAKGKFIAHYANIPCHEA